MVEMKGELLRQVLDQGERNRGGGGYLQLSNIRIDEDSLWLVGNEPIDPERSYTLAISDYLVSGNEQGFDFLNRENPLLQIIKEGRDVRLALIEELRRRFGSGL